SFFAPCLVGEGPAACYSLIPPSTTTRFSGCIAALKQEIFWSCADIMSPLLRPDTLIEGPHRSARQKTNERCQRRGQSDQAVSRDWRFALICLFYCRVPLFLVLFLYLLYALFSKIGDLIRLERSIILERERKSGE
ncbi:hypothetical protein P154DRAFT_609084, partial [Amniculicola lignicola CBS 123094]